MKTTQKLKSILQKDDTQQGFKQFQNILKTSQIHTDDRNLLLRWAVQYEKKYFAQYYKMLSQFGADVNFVDTKEKKSNLMIACEKKKQEIVQVLVNDNKVNLLLQDLRNKTALSYAIANKFKHSCERFVRTLIKKCPQLMKKDYKKNNPLIQAINSYKVQIVRILIQNGFNYNQPFDDNGATPLHQIFRQLKNNKNKPPYNSILQMLQIMLQKGADPYKKNNQGKTCLQFADRFASEFQQLYQKIKNKSKDNKQEQQNINPPVLTINNANQRQQVFSDAEKIYKKYKFMIQPTKQKKNLQVPAYQPIQQEQGYNDDPFEKTSIGLLNKLSLQIQNFASQVLNEQKNVNRQLQQFINYLSPIANELGFMIEIYGSYATGLWINQCDIDVLLVPTQIAYLPKSPWEYLQIIAQKLKGSIYEKTSIMKNIKIPQMRVQLGEQKQFRRSRRLDVSILTPNNNGKQHTQYVKRFLQIFPQIKPLFFVVKRLTHCYKLYDPTKAGVKSFALFLMFLIFMQQTHSQSLGDLLIKFFYKFGYNCQYQYEDSTGRSMMLNLPDPINSKNNMGKNTDAFALQRMFKTAYLVLHTRDVQNRLQYLFQSRQMFFQKY